MIVVLAAEPSSINIDTSHTSKITVVMRDEEITRNIRKHVLENTCLLLISCAPYTFISMDKHPLALSEPDHFIEEGAYK